MLVFFILSPSLACHPEPRFVILSEAKDLVLLCGVNSAKDLTFRLRIISALRKSAVFLLDGGVVL
jgi:hypothetical protein